LSSFDRCDRIDEYDRITPKNRIRPIIEGLEAIGRADGGMSNRLEAICGSVRPAPTAPRGEKTKARIAKIDEILKARGSTTPKTFERG